jgi:hypothetical protein
MESKSLPGDQFGKLTLIEYVDETHVRCRCTCGKEEVRVVKNLRKQRRRGQDIMCRSCVPNRGRRSKYHGEELRIYQFYNTSYGRADLQRKGRTRPDFEWFKVKVKEPCFYCGRDPYDRRLKSRYNDFVANGIDRLDNDIDYIEENCVPCCSQCNYAKRELTKEQFIELANLIVSNFSNEKGDYYEVPNS